MKNYKHQDIAIERYKDRPFFGLGFDCGTGKTRTGILIADDKELPVLVICPKNLMKQWKEAIEKNSAVENEIFIVDVAKSKSKKAKAAFEDFLTK